MESLIGMGRNQQGGREVLQPRQLQRDALVALKLPVNLLPSSARAGEPATVAGAGNSAASSAASSSPSGNGQVKPAAAARLA